MPGETTIFVAAMNPSVVLLVDNGRPVRVGEPFTLREGEHIRVPPFSDVGNDADVIVPIHSHSVLARRVTHDLEEPRLVLSVAGRRFLPMFEIALPLAASETLAIFKAVPAGRATLSISGEFWMPQALMFDIPVRGTVTLDESIAIDPAAIVEVVFSHSVEQARTKKNGVGQSIRVRLMRCDGSYDCVETAEQEHFGEGSVRFFGVPLGTYHVEARSGDGSTVGADTACTNPGDLTALHFELP